MDDTEIDRMLIAAGIIISVVALAEIYPAWKRQRN